MIKVLPLLFIIAATASCSRSTSTSDAPAPPTPTNPFEQEVASVPPADTVADTGVVPAPSPPRTSPSSKEGTGAATASESPRHQPEANKPKTPQEQIVGMWIPTVRSMDAPNVQQSMTFSADGRVTIRFGATSGDGKYRFVTDKEIELTSPQNPDTLKFTISSISNAELVLTRPGQERPDRFRRANLLEAIGF
jgi:hypothetical protein